MTIHSREHLAAGFRELGVEPGDTVMLHASVRSVGPVAGGPDTIHLALKDALGKSGTLFMYAGCPQYADEVGRGHLSPEDEAEILEKLPAFDPQTARSDRSNGALVEFLRTWPDTKVNSHVARFAAWGAKAEYLLEPTPWMYPYGRGSLFERFVELDGKILLLGSDHDNVTFLHHAEHIVDIPDKRVVRMKVPVIENGERVWRDTEEVDTSAGAHAAFTGRFFAGIVDEFIGVSGIQPGKVGDSDAWLLPAKPLLDHALRVMKLRAAGATGV
jgi:aminoglycoside 3-N-acetyltransferase